jgi:hypothetical protein
MNLDDLLASAKALSLAQDNIKAMQTQRKKVLQDLATVDADIASQQLLLDSAKVALDTSVKDVAAAMPVEIVVPE